MPWSRLFFRFGAEKRESCDVHIRWRKPNMPSILPWFLGKLFPRSKFDLTARILAAVHSITLQSLSESTLQLNWFRNSQSPQFPANSSLFVKRAPYLIWKLQLLPFNRDELWPHTFSMGLIHYVTKVCEWMMSGNKKKPPRLQSCDDAFDGVVHIKWK